MATSTGRIQVATDVRQRQRRRARKSARSADSLAASVFLTPYLLFFVPFLLLPSLFAVALSFMDWHVLGTPSFVGFANYVSLFHDADFIQAFRNTLYFVLLVVPAMVVLSLLLAVLVQQKVPGRSFVRAVVFLPMVVSVAAIGIIWAWLLEDRIGIVDHMLTAVGGPTVHWLTNSQTVLPTIALVTIWWTVGGNMIIYLAGLQDISPELYEAAMLDGASSVQRFFYVTIPQLRQVTVFVLAVTAVGSFNAFGQVFVLTGGGPNGASFVLGMYIYQKGFVNADLGPASAASVILLLLTLGVTAVVVRLQRS